ncbi:MAG: hypothetical protein BGO78_09735 [Chloroflexi bacterium 44-23]|nr:MAG: hypothetical protein BGO78_09735 [Chloroflexi bacterium 44-23]
MKLRDFLLSPAINKMGLWLGEHTPQSVGYWIARTAAGIIARRTKSDQVRAVRLNQWMLSDQTLDSVALDVAVKKVYLAYSRCMYDFYHNMRNPEAIRKLVKFDDNFRQFMDDSKSGKQGCLGLLMHVGGYDLAGYAIALQGMKPQILSYPNPNEGYKYHNELRERQGLHVTPLSMEALQEASRFLKNNGTVITGIDRPWAATNYHPKFFGYESDIPVTTIQLAIRTNVPVVTIACVRQSDGTYILQASPYLEMKPYKDREELLIKNTEMVLDVAEPYLRSAPEQWSMFYPVWPQLLQSMP